MGAFFYLYKRSVINRIKKGLKKPSTYIWLIFIGLYLCFLPMGLKEMVLSFSIDSTTGLVITMSFIAFMMIPVNMMAYAKRKGLAFLTSDVHFMFPAPLSPKRILLYAHLKTVPVNLILGVIGMLLCGYLFKPTALQMFFMFLFATVLENVMEACQMMLMYGNERLGEKGRKAAIWFAYGMLGCILLIALYSIYVHGIGFETLSAFMFSDALQLVPFIGWYIAVLHLIFIGPSVATVIGSVAYFIALIVLLLMAVRMKCIGQFYEDAISFAEDVEEARSKQKNGQNVVFIGKKEKFKHAKVSYKGSGAKALFYRQLLEYKKRKFFIFDGNTLASLSVAIILVALVIMKVDFEGGEAFILPGFIAYIILMFCAFNGKWGKELKSYYTYLIPDTSFKKLFYATLMQLIQAFVNGAIMAVPSGIALGYHPVNILMCILLYVVLSMAKLYSQVLVEYFGNHMLGVFGKQMVQLILLSICMLACVGGAIAGYFGGGELLAYVLMLLMGILMNAIFMVIASLNFEKMEAI